jgi:hypothetical protein
MWADLLYWSACAYRVISLRSGTWSLWGHSGTLSRTHVPATATASRPSQHQPAQRRASSLPRICASTGFATPTGNRRNDDRQTDGSPDALSTRPLATSTCMMATVAASARHPPIGQGISRSMTETAMSQGGQRNAAQNHQRPDARECFRSLVRVRGTFQPRPPRLMQPR